MSGLPQITVIGTVVADPELRFTPAGAAVANWTVAANERKRNDAGEWVDGAATFLRCSAWRDMAENVANSLTRGTRVVVIGRLRQREFEKDGVKRTVFELDVDEVAPSLRWATAKVTRASSSGRDSGGSPAHGRSGTAGQDPWGASEPAVDDQPPW